MNELPNASWFCTGICRMLGSMTAPAGTWKSYARLLARLLPRIGQIAFAGTDGLPVWSSEPHLGPPLEATLTRLAGCAPNRHNDIDGIAALDESPLPCYGFRLRGALGEVLGYVAFATPATPHQELGALHALIKPALDCLQSELSARTAIGELHENMADHSRDLDLLRRLSEAAGADGLAALEQIPALALEHLNGAVAAILVPDRNLTLCRTRPGESSGAENDLLAQMRQHLMTRAQLHDCTLVANKLALEGSNAAVPYKAIFTPIRDEARRVVGVLAVFRPDTEGDFQLRDAEALELLARKSAQMIRVSFDVDTGMLLQSAFLAQATMKLAVQPQLAATHALLYIDIDQLSVVNENHGMHIGDEVIHGVAALLRRRVRDGVLVARIGGDRFAMFVPGCRIEPAARIAEDLRGAAVRLSGARGEKALLVSLSIGVARIGDVTRGLEHALATAEIACRAAKERGRNRVEIYYGNVQTALSQPAAVGFEAQVSAALAGGTFELLAQPILPLSSAPADPRFEILLRMRGGDGTRLGLEKLTASAGCRDLLRNIDRWVIEQSVERIAGCRDTLRQHPAKFSLNLSAASLADADFWRMLEERVRTSRIEPGTLSFEFPEEAVCEHIGMIAPCMRRLREQGVSFALDNFGRGLGSLANLNSLPVSCIKIDGSFSRDLLDNSKSQSMMLAIATLAKTFGMESVAGHIETDAIRARAAHLGVDYGQGFFIGKPLPFEDVIRDLPLYSCFATSTGLFDAALGTAAALRN